MATTKLSSQLSQIVIIQLASRFMLSKKIFAKSDIAFHQNLCWEEILINSFIDLNLVILYEKLNSKILTISCLETNHVHFNDIF